MNRETTLEPTLGETIRAMRIEKRMSMRDFAAKAGLKSVAFIADVERGFRNPSPEVLVKMAHALDVPVQRLRSMDTRPPVAEIRTMTHQNPEWASAFREVVDLAEKGVAPQEIIRALRDAKTSPSMVQEKLKLQ
jgi:transcriptional regulator with XRE-family HTH domain